MVKIDNSRWKTLEVDENNGQFNGLIGIEECNDYNLAEFLSIKTPISEDNEQTPIVKKPKKKKKKKTEQKPVELNQLSPSKHGTTLSDSFIVDICENTDTISETCNVNAWDIVPLPDEIKRVLLSLKFYQPTEIQAMTLPAAILGRRDILGAAETGSGKTLAFGLPIICGILKIKEKLSESESKTKLDLPFLALILAPTRELAIQIKNHLTIFCKTVGIRIGVVVGGMACEKQERILNTGPEIVVGTPGRLWELIEQGNPHLSKLSEIKYLAIDETDRMLERGHFKELDSILERVNLDEEKKHQRQNFVFSATLTLTHELPQHLALKKKLNKKRIRDVTPLEKLKKIVEHLGINNPKTVDITKKGKGTAETLTESRITCNLTEKDYYVYYFLEKYPGRTLIFCNSIGCVKRMHTLLELLGCQPIALHASMQQRQRLKNLDRFRDKENSIMIATDVAARGLDIPCVDHVIHYQTPRTSEGYIHRSGRTARASNEGVTILLIEPNELINYLKLCRTLGKSEDIPTFPIQESYLNAVKERVNLAREVDKLNLQVKKTTSESGWLEKAAEEMDIVIDNKNLKHELREANSFKKVAQIKRKQLQGLLQKPLFSGLAKSWSTVDSVLGKETPKETALNVMKNSLDTRKQKLKRFRQRPKVQFKGKRGHGDVDAGDIKKSDLLSDKNDRRRKKFKRN